jgi:uncharacterized protein
MSLDWVHFSPWSALAGGALIGAAASLFMLLNGRIAGISGLLGSALEGGEGRMEKLLFLAGLLLAPLLWSLFAPLPALQFPSDGLALPIAGLLVGLGTRYAAGCTSGFATVFVLRHLLEI